MKNILEYIAEDPSLLDKVDGNGIPVKKEGKLKIKRTIAVDATIGEIEFKDLQDEIYKMNLGDSIHTCIELEDYAVIIFNTAEQYYDFISNAEYYSRFGPKQVPEVNVDSFLKNCHDHVLECRPIAIVKDGATIKGRKVTAIREMEYNGDFCYYIDRSDF